MRECGLFQAVEPCNLYVTRGGHGWTTCQFICERFYFDVLLLMLVLMRQTVRQSKHACGTAFIFVSPRDTPALSLT
jgi:hypothetical protein